jgi:two-component system LytT family response regulator
MSASKTCFIVEDEERSARLLANLLGNFNEFDRILQFPDAEEALPATRKEKPSLIFLDIMMPGMSGLDLLLILNENKQNVPVIFTTAYDNFVLDALRLNAIDYLIKPISYDDLQSALERYKRSKHKLSSEQLRRLQQSLGSRRIRFNTRTGFELINEDDVMGILADGRYSNIILKDGREFLVSYNLGRVKDMITSEKYIRIHRSAMVGLNYISGVDRLRKTCICRHSGHEFCFPMSSQGLSQLESALEKLNGS